MKVHRIFFKTVVRGQVHAAAKPANHLPITPDCGNHSHIHMHGRHIGVARMEHQRHALSLIHIFWEARYTINVMLKTYSRWYGWLALIDQARYNCSISNTRTMA